MESFLSEIERFYGKKYSFISTMGYFIAALNSYICFAIVAHTGFSVVVFIALFSFFFVFNFVFCGITSLYIDMQTDKHIRAKELFFLYGITEYLTLLFIPLAYLSIAFNKKSFIPLVFIIFSLIWILRIWVIKRRSGFGMINAIASVFFPHILIFLLIFVIAVSGFFLSLFYGYGQV
ncbi:MAG: hypothetical protein K6357_02560 [Elusimicrobiota bacterium]